MSDTQPPSEPSGSFEPSEILDSSAGTSIAADAQPRNRGRKRGLLIGGGVAALLLVGGGAWAVTSFLSTGAQPAEALPAGTLGYASVDLDPSGGQKLEALRTLNKFPALKDSVGINADDDLRESIFDAIQGEGACEGLDYASDIEPWLGNRAAIAAINDDSGAPQPVVVLQVSDADAAEQGLAAIKACGGEGDKDTGWVIQGDWATVAPTAAVAEQVVKDAEASSLADDEDFQELTGEAGDTGVAAAYVAPDAGPVILEQMGESSGVPESLRSRFTDFKGFAATARFSDGALEVEAVGEAAAATEGLLGERSVADPVDGLPDDPAAVLGVSLGDDWVQQLLDQVSGTLGASGEQIVAQLEQSTGLQVPEDLQTLTGDSVVLAVGPGLDPEALVNAADPSAVPVAVKLQGDADSIEAVLDKIRSGLPIPAAQAILASSAAGDTVVVGPDETYRAALTKDGGLGDSNRFSGVVPDADSPTVLYVDVDAFDAAITSLAAGDQKVLDNLEPLSAIGFSTTVEGDLSHAILRISTDD